MYLHLPTSFFLTNYLTDINLDIYQKRSCDILIVVISHTGVTNKRNKIYHEFNIFKSGEDLVALLFFLPRSMFIEEIFRHEIIFFDLLLFI